MTDAEIMAKIDDIKLRWIKRRHERRMQERLDAECQAKDPANCTDPNCPDGSPYSKEVAELLGKEHKGVKGKAAIDKLLEEKNGYVKNAFSRNEIGSIDLVWGNDEFGLQHIIKRRNEDGYDGESFLSEVPNIIRHGKVKRISESRYEISHQDNVVVISSELRKDRVTFVLTAYERY